MIWHIYVLLRILVANVLLQCIIKKIVGSSMREKVFFLQFFLCAIFGWVLMVALSLPVDWFILAAFGTGVITTIGTFFQWETTKHSQSVSAITSVFYQFIGMAISYIVFQEGRYLNTLNVSGIVISMGSVILLGIHNGRKTQSKGNQVISPKIWWFVFAYSSLWGISVFLQKYFAAKEYSLPIFIAGWYTGAACVAGIFLIAHWRKQGMSSAQGFAAHFHWKTLLVSLSCGFCLVASLGLAFWAYQLAPLILVQPILIIAEVIFPALMGFWIFKEAKGLDVRDFTLFAAGIIGAILVATSFWY